MKNLNILFAAGVFVFLMAACSKDSPKEEGPVAPKFEFSIQDQTLAVDVESSVTFSAKLVEGTDVSTSWTVDGELAAGTPSFTWKFSKVGVSTVHFEGSNSVGSVKKDYTVTVNGIPLDVEYSVASDVIDAIVGTPVEVSVTLKGGDKGTVHSWKLDGAEIGTGLSVSLNFTEDEVGAHTLVYAGVNTDGMSATRTWNVEVRDLPLELSYTPEDGEVAAMEGDEVVFGAKVVHGSKGIAYSWKVDGTEVATTETYTHVCSEKGTFNISVSAGNAAGETSVRNWTLTVNEKVLLVHMYLDAETLSSVPSFVSGNTVSGTSAVQIVDNPFKTETNSGSKVFIDDMSACNWSSSGYVQINLNQIGADEKAKYTKIRLKVYLGANQYVPYMRITVGGNQDSLPTSVNGTEFYPSGASQANWTSLIKTNDWNILEYDVTTAKYNFPEGTPRNLAAMDQFQFRFIVDYNNNNAITSAGASESSTQIIYFDDVELVE